MTAVLTLPVAVTTLLGCGTPLHPAAAAGGHDRHPSPIRTTTPGRTL